MEFLRAIKIRSTTFFGAKVKSSVPCRMLKNPRVRKKDFVGKFTGHFFAKFLPLLYQMSLLAVAGQLWWTYQE
jgi:hypothetical protein